MKKNVGIGVIIFVAVTIIVLYLFLCFGAYMYPLKYTELIEKYAIEYSVDQALIASIINVESGFDENAESKKGAKGLMQITDKTAAWLCEKLGKEYNVEKLFDAEFNIMLGSYYISYLLIKFDDLDTALASYNAGEGTVRGWLLNSEYSDDGITISSIPYEETKNYVQKVHKNMEKYAKKIEKQKKS